MQAQLEWKDKGGGYKFQPFENLDSFVPEGNSLSARMAHLHANSLFERKSSLQKARQMIFITLSGRTGPRHALLLIEVASFASENSLCACALSIFQTQVTQNAYWEVPLPFEGD